MKIVIISLDAFSLFDTRTRHVFGGSELRSFQLTQQLSSAHKANVIVVTKDQGIGAFDAGGVRVIPHPLRKGNGYWERRRTLSGRIKHRVQGVFMRRKDNEPDRFFASLGADIFLILGMNPEAKEVEQFCSKNKVPYIFGCASDLDLDEKFYKGSTEKDSSGNSAAGYWEVIQHASLVLAQNRHQQQLLKNRFNKESFLMLNPVDLSQKVEPFKGFSSDVMWIGKTSEYKRPEVFIEMAKKFSDRKFLMIMNNTNDAYWKKINAAAPANTRIVESIPAAKMETVIASTRVFMLTSSVEGFPNTVLQAGKYGKPVVSLSVDPDGMFSEKKAGIVCDGKMELLEKAVRELLTDADKYSQYSKAITAYVKGHDRTRVVGELFEQIKAIFKSGSILS